ncbi:MAG: hypothetical protein KA297_31755 [Kofleriaceae bacterium]|nr:hypothetical protein [Kofleriaceae bacterium]
MTSLLVTTSLVSCGLVACGAGEVPAPKHVPAATSGVVVAAHPSPTQAASTAAAPPASQPPPPAAALQPPPPDMMIIPRVGQITRIEEGYYDWTAWLTVDPAAPEVQRVIAAARESGVALDAGDAGLTLFAQQLRAAGQELHDVDSTHLTWIIPSGGGKRLVTADSSGDGTDFRVNVGVIGG